MAWKRPRIALLFAGGTAFGGPAPLARGLRYERDLGPWLDAFGEAAMIADIEPRLVAAEGVAITLRVWERLAQDIARVLPRVDGAVVVVEPASAVMTAIALEAMISVSPKPIVVVPGQSTEGGGRSGVINGLQTAAADLSGVLYIYGGHILLAGTLHQAAPGEAVTGVPVGKIDFGVRLFRHEKRRSGAARIGLKLVAPVELVAIFPDGSIPPDPPRAARGVVMIGDPRISLDIRQVSASWRRYTRPVVITGSSICGLVPKNWYVAGSMSGPAAAVRLMAALGASPQNWRQTWRRYEGGQL